MRQAKEIRYSIRKEEVKLTLLADYIVLHIENLEPTKKVLELINKSIKLQNTKLIYKSPLYSYTLKKVKLAQL